MDKTGSPRFFTTSVFLLREMPQLDILTVPSGEWGGGHVDTPKTDYETAWSMGRDFGEMFPVRGVITHFSQRVTLDEIAKFINIVLVNAGGDKEQNGFLRLAPIEQAKVTKQVLREPFPVMNSPITGSTIGSLVTTAGSGAAFLAYVPHPDLGQIAVYFLVLGGTKIVIGASDGVAAALKLGLSHLILKWMGYPEVSVNAEKKQAAKRAAKPKQKANKDQQDPTPGDHSVDSSEDDSTSV
ncbi:hypothetical protein PQQ87_08545 [Paraburkholderia nemoris]|uniref:hypothetical protein n=1 Tax=Paraburkholderia nemoris TaxID=2793076 RepID=UPI0038BE1B9F